MNRYILIHRLRGPAVLLLIGGLALLDQMGAIDHFWRWFWPLLMILMGVLLLAERAAMANEEYYPAGPYPGPGYPGGPYQGVDPNAQTAAGQPQQPGTAIVPAQSDDFGNGGHGGQL
jgi:hypothetical protein